MEVMNVNLVLGGVVTKLVGRSVSHPGFRPTASHPHREAVRVVIAPPRFSHHLGNGRAAELAPPDDQRVLKQPTLFEIGNQGRHRLIRSKTLSFVLAVNIGM